MPKSALIGLSLAAVAALLLTLFFVFSPPTVSYVVEGRVAGFGQDEETVFIEHEDIPGFMPSMTMPFKAENPDEIAALDTGESIRFTLNVRSSRSSVADIERIPDSLVTLLSDPASRLPMPDDIVLLDEGDAVPNTTLTNQDAETFSLRERFAGQPLALTFIYTRCPLPDYCPRMSAEFEALQQQLASAGVQAHLLSISFDPEYDTPAILSDYASRYTDDTASWSFATGSPESVAEIAAAFGVFYEDAGGSVIDHNLATAVIDADGQVREIWRGNEWEANEVFRTLEGL
ncbi:MAG: SCO family protein [Bacteroidota bacterium]